jgi:hypothetical protein
MRPRQNSWTGSRAKLKPALVLAVAFSTMLAPAARGEMVQEFNYELKDIKLHGGFTVVFSMRSYDTAGVAPPVLTSAVLRLPAGAKIRREFLTKRFLCDVQRLKQTKDPKTCRNAELGRGRVLVDTRPFTNEMIPAKIYLFLAKGTDRNAVASIAILGIPDDSAPVVSSNPFIRDTKVVLQANFFNEPTPDGAFAYKLVLPTGPINGINVSVAQVTVTIPGLTMNKRERKCVKRERGKCEKSRVRVRRIYWFTLPRCPPSGSFRLEATFGYAGLPSITRTVELSCSRFAL